MQSYTVMMNWEARDLHQEEAIIWGTTSSLIICAGRRTLWRNEVFSFTHWSLQSTKRQCAIHSHVFHLYSTGGNGGASLMSLADTLRKTFSTSPVVVPVRWISPLFRSAGRLIWMRPTYLPTPPHPNSLFRENRRRALAARHDFHPLANKKSRIRVSFETKETTCICILSSNRLACDCKFIL